MFVTERKTTYTADDYMMPEEGAPFQLINNELIMSPSPNSIASTNNVCALGNLYSIEIGRKGKWMYAGADVKFDEGNVLQLHQKRKK